MGDCIGKINKEIERDRIVKIKELEQELAITQKALRVLAELLGESINCPPEVDDEDCIRVEPELANCVQCWIDYAMTKAREINQRSKPSDHVCGLQGFGAPGDSCPACEAMTKAREDEG